MFQVAPNIIIRFGKSLIGFTLLTGGPLVRNAIDANVIGGLSLAFAQGQSGTQAFAMGLLKRFPMMVSKMGGAAAASLLKYSIGLDIRTSETVEGKKVKKSKICNR